MSIRSTATRLGALVGAAALLGGLALTAGGSVLAQTGTATPTPAAATATASPLAVNQGGPAQVPTARFFGTVTVNGAPAPNGTTVVASIGGVACGFGTVTNGSYYVDIQYIQGCMTPGATVSFTVDSIPANSGTLPATGLGEGNAVPLNLTAQAATATPVTTPPPPPTVVRTTTPPPPPTTVRTATATPVRTATTAPASTQTAQKPSGAQKPTSAQAPAGAQKPVGAQAPVAAQAPAGVRLPNTGNGGVSGNGMIGFGLLGILLGAATLTISGLAAYRRSR